MISGPSNKEHALLTVNFAVDCRVDGQRPKTIVGGGGKSHSRYGIFQAAGCKIYSLRYIDPFVNGPIPPNRELHHPCRYRACVYPSHPIRVGEGDDLPLGEDAFTIIKIKSCLT